LELFFFDKKTNICIIYYNLGIKTKTKMKKIKITYLKPRKKQLIKKSLILSGIFVAIYGLFFSNFNYLFTDIVNKNFS